MNGTLTVTKAALTITAGDATRSYGAANPALAVSYSGFANGDTAASLTTPPAVSTPATSASGVGTYAITASGAASPNYTFTYVNGTLTVTAATLTITANDKTKVYGAANPALTVSYSGFVNGDTSSSLVTAPSVTTTATAGSSAGTYPITAGGAVANANYAISYVAGTLTVTRAAVTVTANDATRAYGAANPTLTASYNGFVHGDTAASLTTAPTVTTSATGTSSVGTYAITASGAASPNYTFTYVNGTLTITAATLTITADDQTKTYGAAMPALTVSYSGFVNGDTAASLTTAPGVTTTATAGSSAGTYAITAGGAVSSNSNYTISYAAGTLTVTRAAATITANDQTRSYGGANPALTVRYSGFVNGDTAASLTTAPSASTPAAASSVVGTYAITPAGAVSANYTFTYVNGTLTVTAATLTITANDVTKAYGAAMPALTVSYSGFVNGDTAASLTTAAAVTTTATASSAAGTYPITASGAVSSNSNYTISYVPGTLTVSKVALTVTADDHTRAYGAANPALTASFSGFKNGDTLVTSGITGAPLLTTAATTSSGAGSYPITAAAGSLASANYSFTFVAGTLTVTKAGVTVTAGDQTRAYGAANPTLAVSYTGFVNGDTAASLTTPPAISTTATGASVVGTYPITAGGAVSPNYTFTYVNGTLTVTAATLTISADDKTKAYGAAMPALTVSYSGFVNGDTAASLTAPATVTTTATAASGAGTYAITASGAASSNSNYTISYAAGTLTVTRVALTVTADDHTRSYGAANPAMTVHYSGFVNGDTAASLTTPPAVSTAATASSVVGTYAITASGAASPNYSFTYVNGALTITAATLTITANDATKAYGAAMPALTASYSGFVNGDTAASLTTPAILTTTATASSAVGTYAITASGAASSNSNYTISYAAGTLTITKAAVTITADDQTRAYGAANPTLTVRYAGFVNGDTAASLTTPPSVTTAATASSTVGAYAITASGAASPNYSFTYVNGKLTVTAATLTITANDKTKAYGAANPVLTVSYSGFVNGDTAASLTTAPAVSTTATAGSGAGTYAITASGAVSSNSNYTISYVAGTLTVTKAAVTVTADDQSRSYGTTNPALTVRYAGFVNGDTPASLSTPPAVTTAATSGSSVGSYAITPSGAVSSNYTFTYVNGTLTITAASITVTANNKTRTYGAANPTLTVSYSGFVNGDTAASLTTPPSASTTATPASIVGTYPITVGGAVSPNYTFTYVNGTLTITAATLTITANDATKAYGAAMPALTVSYGGFVNGDTAASLTTPPAVSTTATASSGAGTYPITANGAVSGNSNYTISYAGGTLTVTKAVLTVTADDQTRSYGAANPTLTARYSGFVNGDTSASLATPPAVSTTAAAGSAVGTYPIAVSGAAGANYTFTYVNGTLTIDPATLTIAADDKTKVYGTANPVLTAHYSGFVNGDTAASLTTPPVLATTATSSSAAGTYAITANGAVSSNSNYTISYVAGTLTITKAALTVTADDRTKTYGSANPSLTVSYSGFANGDTAASLSTPASASTAATAASIVGTYPITVGGAVSPNYTVTYANGTLTVTAATLTITANNATRAYGAANPSFSVSYSGFVNGDTAASVATPPSVSTAATAASGVGTYAITASGAVAGSNYTISYVAGTLTITKTAVTVTADNQTKTYGAANPALTVSYSGFANGDTAAGLTTAPVATTTATSASAAGSYPITPGGAASSNYTFTYVNGTLTVSAATLTITADDETKTYGAANPALTVSYSGFVNGDTAASLTAPPAVSTTATTASGAGTYPIVASGAVSSNYSIAYASGTLTVTRATLTISANNRSRAYGASNPSLTVNYTGFVNGDSSASLTTQPTVTTAANTGSPAGSYPITPSGAAAANYTIVYVSGTLTVTKAALTVTAANASRAYGASNPAFPINYSGFVNGDTAANLTTPASVTTTATSSSAPGTYAITPAGASEHELHVHLRERNTDDHCRHADDHRQRRDAGLRRREPGAVGELQRVRQRRHGCDPHDRADGIDAGHRSERRRHLSDRRQRRGERELHDQLRRRHADGNQGRVDGHRRRSVAGVWRGESGTHRVDRRLQERRDARDERRHRDACGGDGGHGREQRGHVCDHAGARQPGGAELQLRVRPGHAHGDEGRGEGDRR